MKTKRARRRQPQVATSAVVCDGKRQRTHCPQCEGQTKLGKKEIVWKTCSNCLAALGAFE